MDLSKRIILWKILTSYMYIQLILIFVNGSIVYLFPLFRLRPLSTTTRGHWIIIWLLYICISSRILNMRVFWPWKRVINNHSQPTANVGKPGRSVTVDRVQSLLLLFITRRHAQARSVESSALPTLPKFPRKSTALGADIGHFKILAVGEVLCGMLEIDQHFVIPNSRA